jgi:nitrile hydratase accessory protein
MAVGLHQEGRFAWEAFRQCLIARIAAWEARNPEEPYAYYVHWLGALEDVIGQAGLLDPAAIDEKVDAIASLPDGADHRHGDHHHHHHHGDRSEHHA